MLLSLVLYETDYEERLLSGLVTMKQKTHFLKQLADLMSMLT